ncbi:polysaccharide deacetylase family protein [Tuberibacillus calidus]|uniref:polysaccharide deacetylase family protein n=1 Tax=Tuberibacillus calidus TaxID=340097 RepID=UPI00042A39EA|nr:polysaccharide deacetylase family protein [Tuberibacillus calidus]
MFKGVLTTLLFVGISVFVFTSLKDYEDFYLSQFVPESSTITLATAKKDPLYKKIEAYAKEHDVAPENARIDRVWKAIPGYNGLRVNVDASYKKMRSKGVFRPDLVVYEEVAPKVHLKDLPPAPIYRGNPKKNMVALLINVAWGDEYLPQMLKTLDKYQVKATFFLDGSWTKKHPDLAMMIIEEGHEIGNHAYNHPDLARKSAKETRDQLYKTNQVIKATLGVVPKWFAPPSGSYTQTTVEVADSLNMSTILWTVDTIDWKHPEPYEMVRRVVSQIGPGSMILMHPTDSAAEGLSRLILDIKNRGYQLGTVSELLSEKRVFGNDF